MSVNVDGVVNTVAATLESVISNRGQIVLVSSVFAYINGAGATDLRRNCIGVDH
jgi:NADP-dependent 3-hydroxy acid dehydrogenase YdfG